MLNEAAPLPAIPSATDQVRLFMLFTYLGGDAARTAIAGRVDQSIIERLAHDFGWAEKIGGRGALDTESGINTERLINRVATYATAQRAESVLTNLFNELAADPKFARQFCTQIDEDGITSFNAKSLSDLIKAFEMISNVKYRALGDKVAQGADTTGSNSPAEIGKRTYAEMLRRFDAIPAVDPVAEIRKVTDGTSAEATPAA